MYGVTHGEENADAHGLDRLVRRGAPTNPRHEVQGGKRGLEWTGMGRTNETEAAGSIAGLEKRAMIAHGTVDGHLRWW